MRTVASLLTLSGDAELIFTWILFCNLGPRWASTLQARSEGLQTGPPGHCGFAANRSRNGCGAKRQCNPKWQG
ncbi:hypothetical protein EDB85DRAFT_2024012 [Lactarius pseudohatsudake]|nr:hypothetical protein EDB85DRAFT_2024012 [Lactarius pseudohatsudake]